MIGTGGHTGELSPDAVLTAIDGVNNIAPIYSNVD